MRVDFNLKDEMWSKNIIMLTFQLFIFVSKKWLLNFVIYLEQNYKTISISHCKFCMLWLIRQKNVRSSFAKPFHYDVIFRDQDQYKNETISWKFSFTLVYNVMFTLLK